MRGCGRQESGGDAILYGRPVPVVPVCGKLHIELDAPDAVELLVDAARELDPAKVSRGVGREAGIARDIGDHLMFLSIVHPEWFEPFRDEAVVELYDRLSIGLDTASVLLEGTSDAAAAVVLRRLENDPTSWRDLETVAGIGSNVALDGLASHARQHPSSEQWLNRLGIHVGSTGPAVRRFEPQRSSLHRLTPGGTNGGFVGLEVKEVADESGPVTWHYLSVRPELVSGLPERPHPLLHVVAPRTYWFALSTDVAGDGRYINSHVEIDEELFDHGLLEIESDAPTMFEIEVRPYDQDLVVCNGHILKTPGVLGTAGGAPIGLYPNPVCEQCETLMFHAATIESLVREYGDGFRSVFYCPECVRASVTGTNWN